MQVQPLELLLDEELEEEDDEELEDEEEQIKYRELLLVGEGIESVIQQVGFSFKHVGDKARSVQEGVPLLQNTQPLELLLEEEELEEDELVVVEQTKLELHMELSRPLLAQHRGVPPRKEQVVL